MPKKLTLLWQTPGSHLVDWVHEIFAPIIGDQVVDGKHKIVLDNCLVVDTQLHLAPPEYYPQFRGKNVFLMREPDEYFRDISGVYVNFCGVFRMHHSNVFRPERVLSIPLGYGNGLARMGEPKRASQRSYVWSMLGQMNKSTRPDALKALISIKPNFWFAADGWQIGSGTAASNASSHKPKENYRQLQAESIFSPAPMGNVQQETNRPYEALECGAIPLLEKQWFMEVHKSLLGSHPLPTFSSWSKAADFVRETIKDPAALDQLQAECLAWWHSYKLALTADVVSFTERHWEKPPGSKSEFVKWYGRIPGWALFELARHHNVSAFRRRVVRHVRRLIEHGRFFERV